MSNYLFKKDFLKINLFTKLTNKNKLFSNNSTCEGVQIYLNCNENSEKNSENDLKRHKRLTTFSNTAAENSQQNFGVRIDIPVKPETSKTLKTIDSINIIQNEALFKNLFNLEQVKKFVKKQDFLLWYNSQQNF